MTKLNVGCGHYVMPGWVNCDLVPAKWVDKVFDASEEWPFKTGSVSEVYLSHVLEHLPRWEYTLLEAARVLRPSGVLTIRVPYGVNMTAYHVRFFDKGTLEPFYVNKTNQSFFLPDGTQMIRPPFKLIERKLNHSFPWAWHLNHYLGIRWFADRMNHGNGLKTIPFGRRSEIIWILKRRSA